ncbi:hypothetical protein [Aurantimonas sp. VKM B-3413]|uniref:hypothetical protein n=1 Tax=Aurantimonas sp. VKM B-3413 TaxID=2779401 RepID=UPI001E47C42A|nr:hypothetical protein [Aurantimonas sp. VKM B-3413]MCB8837076.1 hypothetical protein [Aurantimonas sp. VKM B-3413]
MNDDVTERPETVEIIKKKRHSLLWRYRIARRIRKALKDPEWAASEAARFRSDLSGDLPALPASSGPGVVLAACDDLYYHSFGPTLARSIERHGVEQPMHLHLCAPSAATLADIERLSNSLRHVRLTWTWDRGTLAEGLPFRSIYLASARFLIAPVVLESCRAPVLCLDIDAIANKPIWKHYELARAGTDVVVIQRREETSDSRRVRAGAFGLNPTPDGLRFGAALAGSLSAILPLRPRYHLDQIVIYYLMKELARSDSIRIKDMPPALSDFGFEKDAVIWMAKGWKMKNSPLFKDAQREVDAPTDRDDG